MADSSPKPGTTETPTVVPVSGITDEMIERGLDAMLGPLEQGVGDPGSPFREGALRYRRAEREEGARRLRAIFEAALSGRVGNTSASTGACSCSPGIFTPGEQFVEPPSFDDACPVHGRGDDRSSSAGVGHTEPGDQT